MFGISKYRWRIRGLLLYPYLSFIWSKPESHDKMWSSDSDEETENIKYVWSVCIRNVSF
jgi:hypothetical protein